MGQVEWFVPGRKVEAKGPWACFLRPLPQGVAGAYVEAYTRPGELVLDPFCQNEEFVRESLALGRRVVAATFNPVIALALRARLCPPNPRRLGAIVTRLGDAPKLQSTLREHIEGLYRALCPACRRPLSADYFVWDRERNEPVEKGYRCPLCGSEGSAPVEGPDLEPLEHIEDRGFAYWYVMDRLAPSSTEEREAAERLLALYTPRNLYALATLMLKAEALLSEPAEQGAFRQLFLLCLLSCSSLHPPPTEGARPLSPPELRRLRLPARFLERNVWKALEEAYREVTRHPSGPPVALGDAPDRVKEGEAFVGLRTVRRLGKELATASVALVFTSPPRLERAFWELSYLWSGWLLGRDGVLHLKPLVRERGLDWDWHWRALGNALKALEPLLAPQGHVVFAFQAGEEPLPETVLLASLKAGLTLERFLYRPERDQRGGYRLSFARGLLREGAPSSGEALSSRIRESSLRAMKGLLRRRGEPLAWGWLRSVALEALARESVLGEAMDSEAPLTLLSEGMAGAREELTPLEGKGQRLWWSQGLETSPEPLSERVEEEVWRLLKDSLMLGEEAVDEAICSRFPGLMAPEKETVLAVLSSYGEEVSPGHWRLRVEDMEGRREKEVTKVIAELVELGSRLGWAAWVNEEERARPYGEGCLGDLLTPSERRFSPGPLAGFTVLWLEGEEPVHAFLVLWRATLSVAVPLGQVGPRHLARYVVIPGGRASLVSHRLGRDPLLREALTKGGWQFIKFRHLRRILAERELTRYDLVRIVGLDPIIEKPEAQIPLFREEV